MSIYLITKSLNFLKSLFLSEKVYILEDGVGELQIVFGKYIRN